MYVLEWTKTKIISIILTVFGYSSTILTFLGSFFLTKITISSAGLSMAVQSYLTANFKKINIGAKEYVSQTSYVLPLERETRVAYEKCSNQHSTTIFRRGLQIVLVKSKEHYSTSELEIMFSSLTCDIEKLIMDAIEMYDGIENRKSKSRRFFIEKIYGKLLEFNKDRSDAMCNKISEEDGRFSPLLTFRLLKWKHSEVCFAKPACDTLNNLVFPKHIWSYVYDIKRWKDSESWYKSKAIPWKRGWMLYGKPGTGKTSIARAIGEHLDMPIYSFDLSSFTDQCFSNEWERLKQNTPCIALIEDIDGVFEKRTNKASGARMQQSISFDCLLNTIDGVDNSDGIFTIITTNNIETVDEALIGEFQNNQWTCRPGRIDIAIEFDYIDEECRKELANRILSDCIEHVQQIVIDGDGMTPAQFQHLCEKVALTDFWEKENKKRKSLLWTKGTRA